jgi:N utilization substance protein A
VTVPDFQLSLAIGREGQNARLAARLTGWRIDIRPDTEVITDEPGDDPADVPTPATAE